MIRRKSVKPRSVSRFFAALAALLIVGGAGLTAQWRQTIALRGELELARPPQGEVARLRAENQTLRGKQIPAAELEALRADHAAIPRLRGEVEALDKSSHATTP